ncbi:MAG: aminoglycoside phosphotransferase family protein [Deltaproteobacteria bacterium]|nr:aminoglycoside phosphotransferase family protein [Deltaproteobacteria bacterium]
MDKHESGKDLIEKMDLRKKIDNYLKERFEPAARLEGVDSLGEGVHGSAYRITFSVPGETKHLIMKTLFPSRFGHDHFSDRAQVLLLANANYNEMPKHVKALDIVGDSEFRLTSIRDAREFYIFMEEAKGEPYFKDLNTILERGDITSGDRERALTLASFIAFIHENKYKGDDADILYRRRIRDLIGHGECIMGIADAFDISVFSSSEELVTYVSECLPWWGKIRQKNERLCSVHGDFHPGNIRLEKDDFTLLDRSRGSWGEPADDVSCLSVNYLHYAIKHCGKFDGPFAELFRLFWDRYLEKTGDTEIFDVVQPFFAFRILVITNPRFYADDTYITRRKMLNFGHAVLREPRFQIDCIPDYLEG